MKNNIHLIILVFLAASFTISAQNDLRYAPVHGSSVKRVKKVRDINQRKHCVLKHTMLTEAIYNTIIKSTNTFYAPVSDLCMFPSELLNGKIDFKTYAHDILKRHNIKGIVLIGYTFDKVDKNEWACHVYGGVESTLSGNTETLEMLKAIRDGSVLAENYNACKQQ